MKYFDNKEFDIQGHRGCRGLLPENTLAAFCHALELGVTTLELDTVISKDKKVVVSHEPYMNHEICCQPNKNEITEKNEKEFNLYELNYEEIKQFDCGLKPHSRFPTQAKQAAYKPLLSEVFKVTKEFAKKINRTKPFYFNIETKSKKETDDIFHPKAAVFASLLYEEIKNCGMLNYVMIQSFDVRTLQWFRENDSKMSLALLVEPDEITGEIPSFEQKIDELGFVPDVYSPNYDLVSLELINISQKYESLKIIPWTVNDVETLQKMKDLGVHGIITDYPNFIKN